MGWFVTDAEGDSVSITKDDLSPDTLTTITADCASFYNDHSTVWAAGGWTDGQAGHDFFLTRNGHGAGFWDRSFNDLSDDIGQKLSDACEPYGGQGLYMGDDGRYYIS
jgi:hypothetical protein